MKPQVGTEIKKVRPGLIISRTEFNQKRQKITVLPFTTQASSAGGARVFVASSKENGLT
jgi:mRNA interferase MazF